MLIFIPLALYIVLYTPFIGLYPFHDGNTELHFVYNFYRGMYLSHWMPFHPPAKLFLVSVFFHIFGFSPSVYNLIGLFGGIAGLVALSIIGKTLFNKRIALLSTLFLASSGMYISNAIFNLNDFLVAICLLLALAFYVRKKFLFYGIFASLALLTKESAIIFSCSVVLVEILFEKKLRVTSFLPFIVFQAWLWFLHLTGHQLWNEWNFSTTAGKGSAFTLLNNIITLKIFNKYAYENWLHLFIFNFNWVFWILIGVGAIKNIRRFRKISPSISIIFVYFFLYITVILTFQTYTITRYILPVLPFMYLFAAYGLSKISYRYFSYPLVSMIIFISLFSSSDPISDHIWFRSHQLNQSFYMGQLDGPDAITYNMQYLEFTALRDKIILSGNCRSDLPYLDYDASTFARFKTTGCK